MQKYLTKSEIARQHIQELILSGRVHSGAQITTREVADALGMSETPVREAVKGLAAEGWLRTTAHLGAVVAPVKDSHIREVFLLRGVLNAQAIRLGRDAFTPERLAAIDANIARSEAAVAESDFDAYAELNTRFHELLCDSPDSEWTFRLFNILRAQSAMLRHGFRAVPDGLRKSLDAHLDIRAALRAGEFDRAAELAYRDEVEAGDRLLKSLDGAEGRDAG